MNDRRGSRDQELTAEMETLRAADAAGRASDEPSKPDPAKKGDEEKISVFWRVFGGTILSVTALAAITLYNNITSSISELRAEVARLNEAKGDFARKDDVNGLRLQATTHAGYRTEIDSLKERASKYRTELEDARKALTAALDAQRKEETTALDGLRKELAGLDAMKERLLTLAVDMKAAKDDLAKVRTDVDKNQVADNERRDQRTAQMKQLEDLVKELAKAVQETREKVARLEGVTGPPRPAPADPVPTPPKGPNPRPKTATPTGSGN